MLNIMLMDCDFYQRKGLSNLILKLLADKGSSDVFFLLPSRAENQLIADVVFRNDMVTIRVVNKKKEKNLPESIREKPEAITLHVPFKVRNQSLNDVVIKLMKILELANTDYYSLASKEDVCWRLGLKQYAQLSDTENDVMIMIGRGYDSNHISKMLKRSRKTITTHYRNASRKIGVSNRAEFYRFASFIASCRHEERNTICL